MKNKRKALVLLLLSLAMLLCACANEEPVVEATQEPVELNRFQSLPPIVHEQEYLAFRDEKHNIGIYLNTPEEILEMEQIPDIIAWFEEWNGRTSRQKITMCGTEHIAIPYITWQPSNVSLQAISDGEHDEYIRGYMERLTMLCPANDVLIRFAHEMEVRPSYGEMWYSWQQEDENLYRNAWIRIVNIARGINPNIKWIWSPNRADEYSKEYYPGDEYVDYVGITLNLPEDQKHLYDGFSHFYIHEGIREQLEQFGKKIIISEVAYSSGDVEDKVRYIQGALDYVLHDDHIAAILFFNENKSELQQYQVTDNEEYMKVIYEGMREYRQ